MPKLPVFSGPELIKLALELGWSMERQKGSHVILRKGSSLTVVPVHGQQVEEGAYAAHPQGLGSRKERPRVMTQPYENQRVSMKYFSYFSLRFFLKI